MKTLRPIIVLLTFTIVLVTPVLAQTKSSADHRKGSSEEWMPLSFRDEIKPLFRVEPSGGRKGDNMLIIEHDARAGLDGFWMRTFPVSGGEFYRFSAYRRTHGVESPRRSGIVRILWQDAAGRKVLRDESVSQSTQDRTNSGAAFTRYVTDVLPGFTPVAEAEYPMDKETDAKGWTEVSDV